MTQLIIPVLHQGSTEISTILNVFREDDRWTYFIGISPIFFHQTTDLASFRFITSQLIESGSCRLRDIVRTFGVSKSSVIRSLHKLRKEGPDSFFNSRSGRRSGTILSPDVLQKIQGHLDEGRSRQEIADELGIKRDTLRKAIYDGRLRKPPPQEVATTKSFRSVVDAQAAEAIGTACKRTDERVLAAFGVLDGAPVRFEQCLDVPFGGVLCALPSLLVNGLLDGAQQLLGQIKGYYTTFHIILLLAFMALCRIKTVEKLKGFSPGEFGKLLGLDRIPEVRCLRDKMDTLSAENSAEKWAAHLGKQWLQSNSDMAGTLYVDGHVRLYGGHLTTLPRRYVSRERLCLRGTTDYWVNDALGQPFFVVEKAVDPGLLKVLEVEIVPRLLKEVPQQPSDEELEADPYLNRFVMVFDREGYSPDFFRTMWQDHRISCITYHKHPEEKWPIESFVTHEVIMPDGETASMKLAERGSFVGSGKKTMWMREVRKLTDSGHQTSLISTAYQIPHNQLAAKMFSRWCQENFFRYMMQHFAIDLLQEYGTEDFPDTEKVVNPRWRELNKLLNSLRNKLRSRKSTFGHMTLYPLPEKENKTYKKWLKKKADLLEDIEHLEHQLSETKNEMHQTKKHILFHELEEEDKFQRLIPNRKRFMDTVRMVVYRAETAMATILAESGLQFSDARSVLQYLFITEADILPDQNKRVLFVRVHNTSRPVTNRVITQLMKHLNEANIEYPGTNMKIRYEIRGVKI